MFVCVCVRDRKGLWKHKKLNVQRQCFEEQVETDVKNVHRPQARREKLQHLELWKKLNAGQLYQAGLLKKNTDLENS